eukprot:1401791-Pyramimonas_sp.AAC.1
MFAALLPKADGGFRPIGLLPRMSRTFGQVERREAASWGAKQARRHRYGADGRSCERASRGQASRR